jgi:hypothetical protein
VIRFWVTTTAIAALLQCGSALARDEPQKLRDDWERILCSEKTVDDVVKAARRAKIEVYLARDNTVLTSIRRFNEDKLISAAVAAEVLFNVDHSVAQCRVRVLYTGP